MKQDLPEKENLTLPAAVLILAVIILVMFAGIIVMGLDPYIPLLIDILVVLCVGRIRGISWGGMVTSMTDFLGQNSATIGMILIIGVLIGSFMTCGAVPFVIYYGLKIMNVKWFFVFAVLICFIMAVVTGSSFTSASTIGVAFMGVGISLGIPPAMVAGAIVTGALAGDKHSPLSAVVNLTASLTDVSVYDVEKSTRYTTFPTLVLSAAVLTVLGMRYSTGTADMSQVELIMNGLSEHYDLSPVAVLPLLLMLVFVILKIPAFAAMLMSSAAGVLVSVFLQHETLADCFRYLQNGYVADTGVELLDALLSRGGLFSMATVIIVVIMGLLLAGGMLRLKIMETVTARISDAMRGRFSVIVGTFLMCFLLILVSSDPYIAIVLTTNSLRKCFDRAGMDLSVMSRCLVDGGCAMCGVIPWAAPGIFFSQTLGVSVTEYAPFYLLGFGTVIFTLIVAITGIGVKYAPKTKE